MILLIEYRRKKDETKDTGGKEKKLKMYMQQKMQTTNHWNINKNKFKLSLLTDPSRTVTERLLKK